MWCDPFSTTHRPKHFLFFPRSPPFFKRFFDLFLLFGAFSSWFFLVERKQPDSLLSIHLTCDPFFFSKTFQAAFLLCFPRYHFPFSSFPPQREMESVFPFSCSPRLASISGIGSPESLSLPRGVNICAVSLMIIVSPVRLFPAS